MTPAEQLVARLAELGPGAHDALDMLLDGVTPFELAALNHDFAGWWARPNQIAPGGEWRSWGFLTGRRYGKTRALAEHVTAEVIAGRARRIGICAQNEERGIAVLVQGASGLLGVSPPWFPARWEATAKRVVWPTGAQALLYTPEVPGAIRGDEFDLFWASELQSWPTSTREEALSNALLATSIGYARLLWDCTPKRQNQLIRTLLARSEREPGLHHIVRGTIHENVANLGPNVVADLAHDIGLTTVRGREELLGEMVDDADSMFREEWIDRQRRPMPAALVRRVIACDPAITSDPRYSDRSGIVDGGVCPDGQLYTIANLTAHHPPEALGGVLVDAYVAGDCDLMLIETNRGGEAHVALVRVAARDRGLEVVVLGPDEKRARQPGTVYVRPVNNRGRKVQRLEVAAALTERGSVSFVHGGKNLDELAEQLYGIEPSEKGPNDAADAFAMLCSELADATRSAPVDQLEGLAELTAAALGRPHEPMERPSPLAQAMGIDPRTTRRRLPTMGRKRLL